MQVSDRLQTVFEKIDEYNRTDPRVTIVGSTEVPSELIYGQRMSHWLSKLYENAPDILQIAARAQHIGRWTIPRDSYPMDRTGYLRWRTVLKNLHGDRAGELMLQAGYSADDVSRVKSILRKDGLDHDPLVQGLEDSACLVFLEYYFEDFATAHERTKVVNILKKTWLKMSVRGRNSALKLNLSEPALSYVSEALAAD